MTPAILGNTQNKKSSNGPSLLDRPVSPAPEEGLQPALLDDRHPAARAVRNRRDKTSLEYVVMTAVAGGIAGCSAKTLIAPLDRIKILFQTSNPEFKAYSSSFFGLSKAAKKIYRNDGFIGFFQGHSVTLFRIFPYAAIKFVAYEQIRHLLIPNDLYETNGRRLLAGSISGIISVFFTYPLDLLRVRMAFETRYSSTANKKQSAFMNGRLLRTVHSILKEPTKYQLRIKAAPSSSSASSSLLSPSSSVLLKNVLGITNFYRGFSPTILGMIPYAGVSFWTHDSVHDIFRSKFLAKFTVDYDQPFHSHTTPNPSSGSPTGSPASSLTKHKHSHDDRPPLKAWAQLIAGGVAGLVSQTAAYPFEVIRRRLQVGAVADGGAYRTIPEMARIIHHERGFRGFYVGLSIGYIKVFPMVACSFFVYERFKFLMGI